MSTVPKNFEGFTRIYGSRPCSRPWQHLGVDHDRYPFWHFIGNGLAGSQTTGDETETAIATCPKEYFFIVWTYCTTTVA